MLINASLLMHVQSVAGSLQGTGSSDFVDALTVAVDRMHRVVSERPELGKANVNKRVVLVSNFLDAAKEDPDDSFGSVLVERMTDKAISMEVTHDLCLICCSRYWPHVPVREPQVNSSYLEKQ